MKLREFRHLFTSLYRNLPIWASIGALENLAQPTRGTGVAILPSWASPEDLALFVPIWEQLAAQRIALCEWPRPLVASQASTGNVVLSASTVLRQMARRINARNGSKEDASGCRIQAASKVTADILIAAVSKGIRDACLLQD